MIQVSESLLELAYEPSFGTCMSVVISADIQAIVVGVEGIRFEGPTMSYIESGSEN